MKRTLQLLILLLMFPLLFACFNKDKEHTIILGTTTSTDNSGLLDYLIPYFVEDTGIHVKWVAVGTGAALEMGKNKEADILMVHAKSSELEFMKNGYGIKRSDFMYNDFVMVGPKDSDFDANSINEFLTKIHDQELTFISRGDQSGTHTKELGLWEQASTEHSGSWYIETGQGMGGTLNMASEKQGYTLTDRATYLAMKDSLDLKIVYENPEELKNQYGVIVITPNVEKNLNYEDALILYEWLISDRGQYLISQFGVEEYGQPLFFSNAPKIE